MDKQFILSKFPLDAPEDFVYRKVWDMHLYHAPDLPVLDTVFEPEGIVLGWPLGKSDDSGGRWVHINSESISIDPLGSYSIVYHSNGLVASSTSLIPEEFLERYAPLCEAINLPSSDNWFPFGLTPYKRVSRLLPNHILMLRSLKAERQVGLQLLDLSDDQLVCLIARNLKKQAEDIADIYPIVMGLTAGNESRMLLAAFKESRYKIRAFTVDTGNKQDVTTASVLAKKFGIEHTVTTVIPDHQEEAAWFHRVGECIAGSTMRNATIKRDLPSEVAFIKGMGGEIGRAYYRQRSAGCDPIADPVEIIRLLDLPLTDSLLDAATNWRDSAIREENVNVLDLLYLENRVGCWAAPQLHGDSNPVNLWPFNQPETISAMLSLTEAKKRSDLLGREVVKKLWPSLLSVPINEPLGVRRLKFNVKRWAKHLVRLLRPGG